MSESEKNPLATIKRRLDKLEKIIHRTKPGQISTQFFESLIGKKVSIFLLEDSCDTEIKGTLIAFDEFTIILSFFDCPNTMYYKHAISSISLYEES